MAKRDANTALLCYHTRRVVKHDRTGIDRKKRKSTSAVL